MPTIDELREKVKLAEESVRNVADEALRTKAFEVVLNNLLKGASEETSKPYEETIREMPHANENAVTIFDRSKLAEAAGFRLEELSTVFDFTDNNFRIIANVPGENEGDKQRNAALIVLTANYYCKNQREALATDLRDAMKDLGIVSLVNMATNLGVKSFKSCFVREGARGSKNTKYRITTPGTQRGIELIQKLVKGDDVP